MSADNISNQRSVTHDTVTSNDSLPHSHSFLQLFAQKYDSSFSILEPSSDVAKQTLIIDNLILPTLHLSTDLSWLLFCPKARTQTTNTSSDQCPTLIQYISQAYQLLDHLLDAKKPDIRSQIEDHCNHISMLTQLNERRPANRPATIECNSDGSVNSSYFVHRIANKLHPDSDRSGFKCPVFNTVLDRHSRIVVLYNSDDNPSLESLLYDSNEGRYLFDYQITDYCLNSENPLHPITKKPIDSVLSICCDKVVIDQKETPQASLSALLHDLNWQMSRYLGQLSVVMQKLDEYQHHIEEINSHLISSLHTTRTINKKELIQTASNMRQLIQVLDPSSSTDIDPESSLFPMMQELHALETETTGVLSLFATKQWTLAHLEMSDSCRYIQDMLEHRDFNTSNPDICSEIHDCIQEILFLADYYNSQITILLQLLHTIKPLSSQECLQRELSRACAQQMHEIEQALLSQ